MGVFLKKASIFLITTIVATFLFPTGKTLEYSDYVIGSVVKKEIIAPFTFPILKTEEELAKERKEALAKVPPVFAYQPQIASTQIKRFRQSMGFISAYLDSLKKKSPGIIAILRTYQPEKEHSIFYIPELDSLHTMVKERYQISISRQQLTNLVYLTYKKKLGKLTDNFVRILKKTYNKVIVDVEIDSLSQDRVILRRSAVNTETSIESIIDLGIAQSQALVIFREKIGNKKPYYGLGSLFVNTFVAPNWYFDSKYTQQLKREAIASVPTSRGFVYKNERIVDSHQIVTKDIYRKLKSLSVAIREQNINSEFMNRLKGGLGRFLLAFLIMLFLASYIFAFRRKEIWSSFSKIIMINIIMLALIVISWVEIFILTWNEYTVPFILVPMLVIMLLDGGTAIIATVTAALILGAINSLDYVYTINNLFAGLAAMMSVKEVRKRSNIFTAGLAAWLIYGISILAIGLLRYQPLKEVFGEFFYITSNALLVPFIAYGSLGLFEKFFDITTSFSLLELSDMNHPLLKKLSLKASGTFSHSIEVGNLAEAAAKAIGANSLLTRVGCYYHDIGKMVKSEYFVENQNPGDNKHDSLSPSMSAIVLGSHVKEGLNLAREYGLPSAIRAFIPEHHGTSRMEYFLHKAKELNPDMEIDEESYRYPGPKPQSKETAIVMLADSIEAASRTLKEPSASRIKALIDEITGSKMADGQLDDSNLTLNEISRIKEAFAFYLMSKFHLRIEYPDSSPEPRREETNPDSKKNQENNPSTSDKQP